MDLKGSLVDTNLRIIPSKNLIDFLKTINISKDVPRNIIHIIKDEDKCAAIAFENINTKLIQLNDTDYNNLRKIKEVMKESTVEENQPLSTDDGDKSEKKGIPNLDRDGDSNNECEDEELKEKPELEAKQFLTTSDLDWLYLYIKNKREKDEKIPYLHELLKDIIVQVPPNQKLKRNPHLEARCVKLRAQQEAREYRKMTKGVDNVRIRFPEDSISYQMKQINRHLIAIGQFLLSIFAGFLFGFRGVEWIVGNLDFGFRLLLGVMCALVIALAEIYFLAKKLNEELSVPETVQLGGPPIYANNTNVVANSPISTSEKEHKD